MSTPERKSVTQDSGSIDPDQDVWGSSNTANYRHFLALQTKTSGTCDAKDVLLYAHHLHHLSALQILRGLVNQRLQLSGQLPELGKVFDSRLSGEDVRLPVELIFSGENVRAPNVIAGNEFNVWLSHSVLGQAGQLCFEIPSPSDISGANTAPIRPAIEDDTPDVYQITKSLCEAAKEETFESGVESNFSRELLSLIREYGNIAIEVLANLIGTNRIDEEVASEVLLSLGQSHHSATYSFRLWLLEKSLTLPSLMIRDGAVLGLAYMDDPHSIPYLKTAIEREECEEVRKVMKKVLIQLEKTRLASSPSKNKKD
ncbi:MAG: HEAT repeat domain-containing protein [Candidatus Manganitrophus sp. SA1]|nr:HEAT repeat domain-containing protein [Candidatus Manganitrophus morganii]